MEFYDDMQEPYWLDEDYRQISEQYFSGMEAIESDWSVMYNLKDYEGERASIFIQNCKNNIEAFKIWKKISEKYKQDSPPCVPAYKRLTMIYEKQGLYENAAAVCVEALTMNVTVDDTKAGMKGRLTRMIKKAGRQPSQQEFLLLEPAKITPPKEILRTRWGDYEMPDHYTLDIRKGPRYDLKKIKESKP